MTATLPRPMTFEQFANLPGEARRELRNGTTIELQPPKLKHSLLQMRITELLEPLIERRGLVIVEAGFRPLPEYEYRIADVGIVSLDRIRNTDLNGYLEGAPDIVIEVLSPSNRAAEMMEKEKICLANGAFEFWLVDSDQRLIRISRNIKAFSIFGPGQEIGLRRELFGEHKLAVDAIFDFQM
ncbi:MAG TPA: Uma2 family endonuclease [Bryobacteraceae bacterium]|nr:Uma2 family endonuclease [Bryobacteraceae bacterium]